MKVLIDTSKKTLKLEGEVRFNELKKFVEDNKLELFTILPDVITVKEQEVYPWYPTYPTYPIYPQDPMYGDTYRVTCGFTEKVAGIKGEAGITIEPEAWNIPTIFYTDIDLI